ncbi:MFS transporter [Marinomonas mediterranea]|uniref:MFS transporter n=1 Tax=Marinomonas mediterranea TaxID=119864 RepID=UPI0023496FD8|nr:MFS transporter [Marinomonas mediterranea]WCN11214.1 MFS transporter [Marinomonas mediterranea]
MPTKTRIFTSENLALLAFILLLALNLRGPVTSFSPLIPEIAANLSLNGSQLGLITTIPLVCFALFALLTSKLVKHFDVYRILLVGTGLILLGMLCRAANGYSTLVVGVTLIGAGIAVGNTLLPSVLKRHFPLHIPSLTALYVLMMSIGGFVIASSSVPLSLWYVESNHAESGWRFALLCQASIVLLPVLAYFFIKQNKPTKHTQSDDPHHSDNKPVPPSKTSIWRSTTAWQVSGFLALNSFLNYVMVAWFPSILIESHFTQTTAGLNLGYMQLAGALPSLLLTPFINRKSVFPLLCLLATSTSTLSIFALFLLPKLAVIWAITFGFSSSLGFILGLSLVAIKSKDTLEAAELSGMAQLLGYSLAAIGPVTFGALHDQVGTWNPLLLILGLVAVMWSMIGWKVSRPNF